MVPHAPRRSMISLLIALAFPALALAAISEGLRGGMIPGVSLLTGSAGMSTQNTGPTTCTSDANCPPGYACAAGGVCKKARGHACSGAPECASGFCSDGVCCESSCGGACEKCNRPGRLGFCDAVEFGADPDNECSAEAASTCGRTGSCSGSRSCQLYPSGTVCNAASCTGYTAQSADTCNGSGTCVDKGTKSCSPYMCSAGTADCATHCTDDSGCVRGFKCSTSTGQCLSIPPPQRTRPTPTPRSSDESTEASASL